MNPLWYNISLCLDEEKNNPRTEALATRHYNYKGTICPLSLACWRMFHAMPGSVKGAAAITNIPAEEICMVNGAYDRQVHSEFGGRNAIDADQAIDLFIDAIEYVRCKDDLPQFEQDRLKTVDRKRITRIMFYDGPFKRRT